MYKVSKIFEVFLKHHTIDNQMRKETLYIIVNRRIEHEGNANYYFTGIVNSMPAVGDKEHALTGTYNDMSAYYTSLIPPVDLVLGQPASEWALIPI